MKPVEIALAGLILCGCDNAASDTFSGPTLSGRVEQRRIATISQPAEVLISNDLAHVAVIDHHGPKQRLTVRRPSDIGSRVDGVRQARRPPFRSRRNPGPLRTRRPRPLRLVVNGVPGPACDAWLDQTSCGPDRTSIAYTAVEISRKAFVAIDGRPGPTYADVSCPAVSPDRTHIAFVACTGQGAQRKSSLIIDGRAGPEYDEIAIPSSGIWIVSRRTTSTPRTWLGWA